jgi:hypothetical protein
VFGAHSKHELTMFTKNLKKHTYYFLASYQVHKAAAMHKCTNGTLAIDI